MPEPKEIGHQVRFPKTLIGLVQRGCWEIPEIMGASLLALIGIGLGIAGCINYIKNDGDNRKYKSLYMIMRPDDPRACRLRDPVHTEYKG